MSDSKKDCGKCEYLISCGLGFIEKCCYKERVFKKQRKGIVIEMKLRKKTDDSRITR